MKNNLKPYSKGEIMENVIEFEGNSVEIFELNGVAYFNPRDVAKCLDIAGSTLREHLSEMSCKHVKKLKNSDVGSTIIRKLNNAGENFLREAGVYKLIFKSRKESAERFQDWIFDVVLPSIRRDGMYIAEGASKEQIDYNIKLLDKTFTSCPVEDIKNEYIKCMDYHKENKTRLEYKKKSKTRRVDKLKSCVDSKIEIMQKVHDVLITRLGVLEYAGSREVVCYTLTDIVADIGKTRHNKTKGCFANANRILNLCDQ